MVDFFTRFLQFSDSVRLEGVIGALVQELTKG